MQLHEDTEHGLDQALIEADSLPKQIESAPWQLDRTVQWERDLCGMRILAALRAHGPASATAEPHAHRLA